MMCLFKLLAPSSIHRSLFGVFQFGGNGSDTHTHTHTHTHGRSMSIFTDHALPGFNTESSCLLEFVYLNTNDRLKRIHCRLCNIEFQCCIIKIGYTTK